MKSRIIAILKSRTVWTFVALFVLNGIEGIKDQIPAGYLPLVNGIVGLLGIYFRTAPKQQF